MRLLLFHPEVASRSCSDCKKWWYDDSLQGERFVFSTNIVSRGGQHLERDSRAKPPCQHCPKGSPEEEKRFALTYRNLQVVELYHRVKATGGAVLNDDDKQDDSLMGKLATIERLFDSHKQTLAITAGLANVAGRAK